MELYLTPYSWPEALGVTLAFALAAWRAGTVSRSGVLGGVAVGTTLYLLAGWRGFVVLGAFFLLGSALTRLGYREKAGRGLAQGKQGRRGASHAAANCAAGLALAALWRLAGQDPALGAALVASFAAAAADTAGTEAGSLFGKNPRLATTLRRVSPGTPGAVSLAGTLAALVAALLLTGVGAAVGLAAGPALFAAVAAGGFGGAYAESLLGALPGFERRLGNELDEPGQHHPGSADLPGPFRAVDRGLTPD